jgi:hypothetical protein
VLLSLIALMMAVATILSSRNATNEVCRKLTLAVHCDRAGGCASGAILRPFGTIGLVKSAGAGCEALVSVPRRRAARGSINKVGRYGLAGAT